MTGSGVRYGSLFSGYGGLDLAVEEVTGAECAWHSELDPNASTVLAAHWPDIPNHGDITAIDWSLVEPVDILCGGSPCQDLSTAGARAGMGPGTRSGLWAAMCRAIDVIRPSLVVWENVQGALSACAHSELRPCPGCLDRSVPHDPVLRAAGRVLGDLATLGFDAEWSCVRASDVGAPHRRERLFLVAWPAADPDGGRWAGRWTGSTHGERDRDEGRLGRVARAGAAPADSDHATVDRERSRPQSRIGSEAAADTADLGHERTGRARDGWPGPADGGLATSDADIASSEAWDQRPRDGHPRRSQPLDGRSADWGQYAAAIARWEHVTGRPAPDPLDDRGRLNPALAEWMMGLPTGWVTDHLGRSAALKAIGNGVVPQQAAHAIRGLIARSALAERVTA